MLQNSFSCKIEKKYNLFCEAPSRTLKDGNQSSSIANFHSSTLNFHSSSVVVTFEVRNLLKFKSSVLSSVDGAAGCNWGAAQEKRPAATPECSLRLRANSILLFFFHTRCLSATQSDISADENDNYTLYTRAEREVCGMSSDRNLRSFPLCRGKSAPRKQEWLLRAARREKQLHAILLCEQVVIIVFHNCGTLFF
jgi:hypothetical protein